MIVGTEHIDDFISFLQKEVNAGCTWFTYDVFEIPRTPQDVQTFQQEREASEYCNDNISDVDNIGMVPLASFLVQLQEQRNKMELDGLLKTRSVIDVDMERVWMEFKKQEQLKSNVMNEDNFKYLSEVKMPGLGFREPELTGKLKELMTSGAEEFQLALDRKYGEKDIHYTLNFSKSEKGFYFLNNYDTIHQAPGQDPIAHRFYADQFITAKEAFNLLEGRWAFKTLNKFEKIDHDGKQTYKPSKDTYEGWVKINFNDTDKNGNYKMKPKGPDWKFDLEEKLKELPIPALKKDPDDMKNLMDSLRRGNVQAVTYEQGGRKEKRYIEASPGTNSLKVYTSDMVLIDDKRLMRNIAPDPNEVRRDQQQDNTIVEEPGEDENDKKQAPRKRQGRRI